MDSKSALISSKVYTVHTRVHNAGALPLGRFFSSGIMKLIVNLCGGENIGMDRRISYHRY